MHRSECEQTLVAAIQREDFDAALLAIERYRTAFDEAFAGMPEGERSALAQEARTLLEMLRRRTLIARGRVASELQNLPSNTGYGSGSKSGATFQVRY